MSCDNDLYYFIFIHSAREYSELLQTWKKSIYYSVKMKEVNQVDAIWIDRY